MILIKETTLQRLDILFDDDDREAVYRYLGEGEYDIIRSGPDVLPNLCVNPGKSRVFAQRPKGYTLEYSGLSELISND